jgi:hypothetical protein
MKRLAILLSLLASSQVFPAQPARSETVIITPGYQRFQHRYFYNAPRYRVFDRDDYWRWRRHERREARRFYHGWY